MSSFVIALSRITHKKVADLSLDDILERDCHSRRGWTFRATQELLSR